MRRFLFISIDRIKENAASHKVELSHELNRVVVHGVLHLIGFNDKSDEERMIMRSEENNSLSLIVSRET